MLVKSAMVLRYEVPGLDNSKAAAHVAVRPSVLDTVKLDENNK